MAPKRSAPPPSPPPPVESSEETASSDDSEEEIDPSSAAAAPNNTAPLPQKMQQPETEDEEDEDEEEEEEEDEEEEEEEEDEEEEEEEDDEAPQLEDKGKREKQVWGEVGSSANGPANATVPSDFDEMCKKYPFLAEELKALERTQPGLFKRQFSLIPDEKARVLDQKIKEQRSFQMKVELRRHDLTKEVTKTLMKLIQ